MIEPDLSTKSGTHFSIWPAPIQLAWMERVIAG